MTVTADKARFYLGIDVGTGSARAGVFDASGKMCGMGVAEIQTFRPRDGFVEQSSDDIWQACGRAVREALAQADIAPKAICGIGFDATCSLVALDAEDRPVSISPADKSVGEVHDVIVWMDHRAAKQAERINAADYAVLKFVGGVISPEMQTPKLLWLKENLPRAWERAARFFDLPDFLTYRATGIDTRSLCSTVCKWTYAQTGGWDELYFRGIGLGELVDEGYRRIGTRVRPLGERIGPLTDAAARDLGLAPGTPVGVSIIDAHAGGIGMLGVSLGETIEGSLLEERVALIGGTSTCHMAVSRKPKYIPGIWGPYSSAMIPGMWLTEGGQSATGALIDHTISSHARGAELAAQAKREKTTVYALLNARLDRLAAKKSFPAELTRDLHVLPDHHGNRSPRANPKLRGMVSGLRLTESADSLALLYLATIQGIAHGTKHILDVMNAHGYRIDTIVACGGDTKNPLFLREHADATGCRIVLPKEPEAVLLGSAILGAVASGDHDTVLHAMTAMTRSDRILEPCREPGVVRFQAAKHRVFQKMYDDQMAYRKLMHATAV